MIKPMLCKLQVKPFNDPEWVWERKWDGERLLVFSSNDIITLQARSGTDKTAQFPELQNIRIPGGHDFILDGEVVGAYETDTFQSAIQPRMNRKEQIDVAANIMPVKYMAFDLLKWGDDDLTLCSLQQRRHLLVSKTLNAAYPLQIVDQYLTNGVPLFDYATANKWEGIVGKRLDEPYMLGKRSWIKVKVWKTETFTCIGYTPGTGKRAPYFGALVLDGVGEVGTGFDDITLQNLTTRLHRTMIPQPGIPMTYQAVQPFTVRIKYQERTNKGQLRFPSFKGVV